jgi:hypothetical protein
LIESTHTTLLLLASKGYLEDDHAGEHEGEREEREGADEVDEVAHEREERGDEDVEAEDEPPRDEAAREVVPGEHALVQPLQPRVHRLVDRDHEQLHIYLLATSEFMHAADRSMQSKISHVLLIVRAGRRRSAETRRR